MFNLDTFKLNSRRAVAFGALAISAIGFSGSAAAAPLELFPFVMTPAVQSAPPPVAAAPSEDEGTVTELPARLKRQIVTYATREAPGTIVIDTPNTYLYFVLGGGQAIRYGIGVGRDGFTWSGVQSISKKAEWPDWTPPPEMIARQPCISAARFIAFTGPMRRAPSAPTSRLAASASPTRTSPISTRGSMSAPR
jgi:lipoprotein-anchoring transpeptidase ErfK/SrfK